MRPNIPVLPPSVACDSACAAEPSQPFLERVPAPAVRPPRLAGQPLQPLGQQGGPCAPSLRMPPFAHDRIELPATAGEGLSFLGRAWPLSHPGKGPEELKKIARQHGCTVTVPFNQDRLRDSVYSKIPGLSEHLDKVERSIGMCFGLSLNWLKSSVERQEDEQFFHGLKDWENDASFLRTLGLQQIEQYRHLTPDGQGLDEPRMLQTCLASVGLRSVDPEQPMERVPAMSSAFLERRMTELFNRTHGSQFFLVLTDTHAMAMRRQGLPHLFDPNRGVVASFSTQALSRVLHDLLERSEMYSKRSNPRREILFCEVEAAGPRSSSG